MLIDESELQEDFIHASGPGGQNVNKVATAVQLRFDVLKSPSLSVPVRQRLQQIARNLITNEGVLIIQARRYRTREQNRQDARERLNALVRQAVEEPRQRHKTRPTLASKQRRLQAKRRQSETKQGRRFTPRSDE